MPPRWIALDTMDTVIADPFFPMLEQDDDVGFLARQGWKNIEAWREFEAGRSSEEEYFARFYGDGVHDGRPHPSLLRDAMHAAYRFTPGMPELLRDYRAGGGRLLLHTNYPCWFATVRERFGLDDLFDRFVVSHEIRSRKPDPPFYAAIAATIGVPPADCLFVDVREANVEGALAAGFDALIFEGVPHLVAALRERGLPLPRPSSGSPPG